MMKNTYGRNIKLSVYGGSHDEEIGMHLAGFPADLAVDMDALCAFLARRAPGNNPYGTPRTERDRPLFITGLDKNNRTTGAEIHAAIYNFNAHSSDYSFVYDTPRPGHADYAALLKYGKSVDLRGGGHFSGRLTAPLCIAGGLALQYLATKGIRVQAHIARIGDVSDAKIDTVCPDIAKLDTVAAKPLAALDDEAAQKMGAEILKAKAEGDSLGGVVECVVTGLPAGLGTHMFDGAEGCIAGALFAIPAVKGVDFGAGFAAASMTGSTHNDAFVTDGKRITTATNNAGGILGGMTTGMPLICRAAFKPTPSIAKSQHTVSISRMENTVIEIKGRHDPCIVPRAVPVVEAAVALALLDLLLEGDAKAEHDDALPALRAEIDRIDTALVALFSERMRVAADVAEYKRHTGMAVTDTAREAALLARVTALSPAETSDYTEKLYESILALSRDYQRKKLEDETETE